MNDDFNHLIKQHRPMLMSYAKGLMNGDAHQAEDLVQEACLSAFKKWDEFDQERSFPAWLRGFVRYKALDKHRASKRSPWAMDPKVIEGLEEIFLMFEPRTIDDGWRTRLSLLGGCIQQLNQHMQLTIELVYKKGLSFQAVGEQTGINEVTAAKRASRARTLIRACIQQRLKKVEQ